MTNRERGRKPTHSLCIVSKGEKEKFRKIGAGWKNEKGAISLTIDKANTISWRDMEDQALYIFPVEEKIE